MSSVGSHWYDRDGPTRYVTPCGRFWVERASADRYAVYGPAGFVDWFVEMADAKIQADWQAECNPVAKRRER